MKTKMLLFAILAVSLLVPSTFAQKTNNVPRFLLENENAGFSSQEGSFTYFDLIKHVCSGEDGNFSAMGNSPWPNAYFVLQMPNPDDVNYTLPFVINWQMRQDEDIVLIGQNPPPCQVFRYPDMGEYRTGFVNRYLQPDDPYYQNSDMLYT